ncbi:hypothetical protein OUZ56_026058 [Daphnia magna]|uniref:Uncharacterized protein n=1 Tax=Daphnia magna TaxID=35525 RepID=A0ABQ9ZKP3_9CRUS|nr:hypothetical protein OUZ56_026058 [Daphnia magna]
MSTDKIPKKWRIFGATRLFGTTYNSALTLTAIVITQHQFRKKITVTQPDGWVTPLTERVTSTWNANFIFYNFELGSGVEDFANGKIYAKCKTGDCPAKKIRYLVGGPTTFTNFTKHLKGVHSEEWKAYEAQHKIKTDPKQQSIKDYATSKAMQRSRQLQLEVQLTYSMAEDNISLNILTKPQFREWIQNGMSGYKLPSTERMRNVMLPKLVAATKQRSLELLKSCTSLNIILDIWSSKQMMGIKHMPGRHTAANVFAEYEQIIGEWQIPFQSISQDKTDGGSNVVFNTFYIPIPGWKEFEDVSCARDYTENFDDGSITSAPAVSNGNGDEEDMVEIDISSTEKEEDAFWTMLAGLEIDVVEITIEDDDDRDEFHEVEAASSAKKAGKIVSYIRKSVLDTEKASYLQETLNATKELGKLSAYELLVLKELVALLKPFKQASDDFQADFESIGNVIPSFLGLRTTLCLKIKDRHGVEVPNPASTLSKTIKHLKNVTTTLEKSLASRFSYVLYDFYYVLVNCSMTEHLCFFLGALLDPPFKKGWIKRSGHSDSDILSAVKVQLEVRYRHYRDCKYFATGQIASDDEVVEAPAEESEGPRRAQGQTR